MPTCESAENASYRMMEDIEYLESINIEDMFEDTKVRIRRAYAKLGVLTIDLMAEEARQRS